MYFAQVFLQETKLVIVMFFSGDCFNSIPLLTQHPCNKGEEKKGKGNIFLYFSLFVVGNLEQSYFS